MTAKTTLKLKAESRDITGKEVRQIRAEKNIPAVVYGHDLKSQPITLSSSQFGKVFKKAGETSIVELQVGDDQSHGVLIHEVQYHPVRGEVTHVDFYAVRMDEKIQADVPLKFIGESPAVKNEGGTLVQILNEIEIESLPMDIPHEIEVDISVLKTFDDLIRVSDLSVDTSKVEIITDLEQAVASVQEPRSEEELAELEEAPEEVDVEAIAGEEEGEEGEEGEEEGEEGEKKEKSEGEEKQEKE